MKQNDQNRISMWWAVRRHLNDNVNAWSIIEPFSNASDVLTQAIDRARAALDVQVLTSKGISANRLLLKQEAVNRTMAIARSTRVYAMNTRNNILLSAVSCARTSLMSMAHHALAARLRAIIAAAREAGEALQKFGVTPESCDAAQEAVLAMEEAQSLVRTAITSRKAVTLNVPLIMATGRKALVVMDNLIHLFEIAYPEFVAGYKTARGINHIASRHRDGPPAAAA